MSNIKKTVKRKNLKEKSLKEMISEYEPDKFYEIKSRRANIRLSEGDYVYLQELAKERCCSVSEIVRNWVADRIMVYRNQKDVSNMAGFMNQIFQTMGFDQVKQAFSRDFEAGEDISLADLLNVNLKKGSETKKNDDILKQFKVQFVFFYLGKNLGFIIFLNKLVKTSASNTRPESHIWE